MNLLDNYQNLYWSVKHDFVIFFNYWKSFCFYISIWQYFCSFCMSLLS